MKKIVVSKSHLKLWLSGIMFCGAVLVLLWLFSGRKLLFTLHGHVIIMMAVGIAIGAYNILYFSGGLFYIGEYGVGMRILCIKKRVIPWSEVETCGVFQSGKINIAYFSTKPISWELQEKFTTKPRWREIDWLAFAEFDRSFMEKACPYFPPEIEAIMRKRARQLGLKPPEHAG